MNRLRECAEMAAPAHTPYTPGIPPGRIEHSQLLCLSPIPVALFTKIVRGTITAQPKRRIRWPVYR